MVQNIFFQMDHKIIQYFNYFLVTLDPKIVKNGSWKSKGMSEKSIEPPSTTDNSFDLDVIFSYCKEK